MTETPASTTDAAGVLVVGGGPAGLTCAHLLGRAGRKVVLVDREGLGGRLANADEVAGLADDAVNGAEFAGRLADAAMDAGVTIEFAEVERLAPDGTGWRAWLRGSEVAADVVVLATGSRPQPLTMPGAAEFTGRGVSYCAACDGPLYRGKDVAVLLGDEWGADEAVQLARHARSVHVLVDPDCDPRAQAHLGRLASLDTVTLERDTRATRVAGDGVVSSLDVEGGGTSRTVDVQGVFGSLGLVPNTELVAALVDRDEAGAVRVDDTFSTGVSGLFVIGEARQGSAGTAVEAIADARALAARLLA